MDRVIDALIEQYLYDMAVLSQPWMYYTMLVPALCYLAFFFVKWAALTAPVWLPLSIVLGTLSKKGKNDG